MSKTSIFGVEAHFLIFSGYRIAFSVAPDPEHRRSSDNFIYCVLYREKKSLRFSRLNSWVMAPSVQYSKGPLQWQVTGKLT